MDAKLPNQQPCGVTSHILEAQKDVNHPIRAVSFVCHTRVMIQSTIYFFKSVT